MELFVKLVEGWKPWTISAKNYVLNTPLSLVVNEVWVDEEPTFLIRTKNQQKTKALLKGTDVVNVEQWTKMERACVAKKSKP